MISIGFKCNSCGANVRGIQTPARGAEDVVEWIQKLGPIVKEAHQKVSPNCTCMVCDLFVPMPKEAEFVGQQIE